ncbi:MAG: hypothetical protein JKY01_00225 [Pseudomonadales bacterium]|nr:hypothetical protein [Pseudomonadales bacterium]
MASKRSSIIIKQTDLGRRKIFLGLSALFIFISIGLAFFLGYRYGFDGLERMTSENLALTEQEVAQNKELEGINLRLSVAEHGSEVTRIAAEEVRLANKSLREEMLELEELVTFYRGVMSPNKNKRGLQVERFNLERFGDKRFRYKLILAQIADHRRYIDGRVFLKLIGEKNGEKANLTLYLRVNNEDKKQGRFRFRYFQKFGGEISLPVGFEPNLITVTAESRGRNAVKISRDFSWEPQQ